jgi:hypothetical protein
MVSVVAVGAATTQPLIACLLAVQQQERNLSCPALQFLVLSVLYNQRTAFFFDGSSAISEVQ